MEPVNPLGAHLQHAGQAYQLWLRRDEWHLYRGPVTGTSFRFFLIIKAARKPGSEKSEALYWLPNPRADVNTCGPFFANCWVTRDKFLKLSRGETQSMKYRPQNRHERQDKKVQVDLPALARLSLGDVFKALEGR